MIQQFIYGGYDILRDILRFGKLIRIQNVSKVQFTYNH